MNDHWGKSWVNRPNLALLLFSFCLLAAIALLSGTMDNRSRWEQPACIQLVDPPKFDDDQDDPRFLISHAKPRSGKWPAVKREYLAEHLVCEACGRTARQSGQAIECHHVEPFHNHPEKELDPANLIALCRRCHEIFGHLDYWASHNPSVRDDARRMLQKIKARPPP